MSDEAKMTDVDDRKETNAIRIRTRGEFLKSKEDGK